MRNKSIEIACRMCDTMIRKFPDASDLPPKQLFHYHQGVFLSGMMSAYELSKNEKYYNYVKEWVDSIIEEDGNINTYDPTRLDDIQPGILLFPLIERTKSEKYEIALQTLINIIKEWKKNSSGGFWHKEIHPNQMWLDSIYMGGPIQVLYSEYSNDKTFLEEAINQAVIMFENMYDKNSGLMFHAWDESKKEEWADNITGLSSEVWGRALGWYVYALLEIIDHVPSEHPKRNRLIEIEKHLLENLIRYRESENKLWYQVVNKGECDGNWLETSCSCLFTAAIAKAVRIGVLEKQYIEYSNECFEAVYESVEKTNEDILVNNVCVGTGVCDYQGYIERPTSENDLHGVGAFLLMCTEIAKVN